MNRIFKNHELRDELRTPALCLRCGQPVDELWVSVGYCLKCGTWFEKWRLRRRHNNAVLGALGF